MNNSNEKLWWHSLVQNQQAAGMDDVAAELVDIIFYRLSSLECLSLLEIIEVGGKRGTYMGLQRG